MSYGVSKTLAALAAGWLLARELRRVGRDPGLAYPLTVGGTFAGFLGAKIYYLLEHPGSISSDPLSSSGFTWYGGLLGGAAAVLLIARRRDVPARLIAGLASAPLAVGYGIGRIGCLLAGDGTYGTPSNLPWAMSFPHGTVPTIQRVHPTPLYETIASFALAALLWRMRERVSPERLFAVFAIGMGTMRLLVEFVRRNQEVALGLSQPQLWSLVLIAVGVGIAGRARLRPSAIAAT